MLHWNLLFCYHFVQFLGNFEKFFTGNNFYFNIVFDLPIIRRYFEIFSTKISLIPVEDFLDDPIQTPKSTKMESVARGKAQSSENKCSLRSKSPEKSNRNHHRQKKDIQNKFSGKGTSYEPSSPSEEDVSDDMIPATNKRIRKSTYLQESLSSKRMCGKAGAQVVNSSHEARRSDVQQHSSKTGMHLNLDNQVTFYTAEFLENGFP